MDQALYDKLNKQSCNKRLAMLKQDRTGKGWDDHWKQVGELFAPRGYRFFATDRNSGTKKHRHIIDNTGIRASNILSAGMMSGMTSPARPWFRLTSGVPDLDEVSSVRQWLTDVTRLMQMVFAKSNTYRSLHTMYDDLGIFGTASAIVMPDYKGVIHINNLTVGEYYLGIDQKSNVDTLYREFELTVRQVIQEFGYENASARVQGLCKNEQFDTPVTITHAMERRLNRDITKKDSKNMPIMSAYFESGDDKPLREGGFKYFRGLCPRWRIRSGDVYGDSPGMEALGDNKQLQKDQLQKSKAIDYQVEPPLVVPSQMKAYEIDTLPGGISFSDMTNPGQKIETAFSVNLDINGVLMDIGDIRQRIREAFFADLFLMLANTSNTNMTATEVAERHEEKLLMLGPVLERLHSEILSPLIEITFEQMMEAGIVPQAPEELHGRDLNVEFVSMLAQAQRAIGTNSVDRFVMSLGTIAQFKPDVLDKFDADYWADSYSDMLGVDPQMVVPGDKVILIRDQRAQQQAQQQAAMQINAGADTMSKLSQAKTTDQSALTDIMTNLQGYGA